MRLLKNTASVLLLSLAGLSSASYASSTQMWVQYFSLAQNISTQAKTAPMAQLKADSTELTLLSKQLLPAFMEKHPICNEYLTAALDAAETMMTISLDEIERDYHADGKLPKMTSPSCYHAKDLLVHPATVAVLASTQPDNAQTREQIGHEMVEVLAHFSEVKKAAGL
ncbi:hypothetical protein HR060_02820 [Catenovulum sp. SM1970]|uniref:hypothetical protein n=1 Tax=Marinifaba aquimaris TaxID=2741323 RepID=UPI00157389FB|nr:hypothetical protein [Marinifaba aquimaris]NTS75788.1 hypothetical protein [Marinifaba aquimaris]